MVDGLDGAYITAEDIGTTTEDMDHVARFTRFAVGGRGRTAAEATFPVTAETVFQAMGRGSRRPPAPATSTGAAWA